MAQPIFEDDSPLESYLADTELDLMPGTVPEFLEPHETPYDLPRWVPSFILNLCQSLETLVYEPAINPTSSRQFAERFKYIIISSSLLSAFLSPTPTEIHGGPEPETPTVSDVNDASITTSAVLLFVVIPVLFASGHWFPALLVFTYTKLFNPPDALTTDRPSISRLALQSLQGLIEADTAWESAVGEAMDLLRRDESSSSMQWQTPLRVGLQSSLQAITTQVDRVRQLFSPLTAPVELAQMTEMYAPPSPTNLHQSLAQQQQQDSSSPTKSRKSKAEATLDKRTTWSGVTSKQMLRRSMGWEGGSPRLMSPVPPVPRLPSSDELSTSPSFGALALDFQRNKTSPQRHSLAMPRSTGSLHPSPTASSRFTTMQNMRNPLSMSSLDSALQAALASKRFACAHLLALRFEEEEDELYWENVRSVIGLLSSSLEDETARLSEAMDDWHKSRQRDARPSVNSTPSPSPSPAVTSMPMPPLLTPQRKRRDVVSFAPQSSDMEKITGHMQSIAGNLDRAFDELESCVASLRKQEHMPTTSEEEDASSSLETSTQAAMSAYESLRRELGMALRECERARGPLLSVLSRQSCGRNEREEVQDSPAVQEATNREEDDSFPLDSPTRVGASSPPPAYVSRGPSQIVDDATAHLLADATALSLPPPGADKIFEADSGPAVGAYRKERSTLSRKERIALAQAKRKSIKSQANVDFAGLPQQPYVLTGEVVDELKAVIKNVNERKQRMAMLPPRRTVLESSSPVSLAVDLDASEGTTLLTDMPSTPHV